MTDEELIARLRKDVFYGDERLHNLARHNPLHMEAADRIEADAATIARLTEQSAMWKESAENYRWAAREAIDAAKEVLADRKAAEAKVAALVDALRDIDALDPEAGHIGACSESAIRGLVLRMGGRARAAIAAAKGGA